MAKETSYTIREIGGITNVNGIIFQKHASIIMFTEKILNGKDIKLYIEIIGDAAILENDHLQIFNIKQSKWNLYEEDLINSALSKKDKESIDGDANGMKPGDKTFYVTNRKFKTRKNGIFDLSTPEKNLKNDTLNSVLYIPKIINDSTLSSLYKEISDKFGITTVRAEQGYKNLTNLLESILSEIKLNHKESVGKDILLSSFPSISKKDFDWHVKATLNLFHSEVFKNKYFDAFRSLDNLEEQVIKAILQTNTVATRLQTINILIKRKDFKNDFILKLKEIKNDIK